MYLALITLVLAVTLTAVLAAKAVRTATRLVRRNSEKPAGKKTAPDEKNEKPKGKQAETVKPETQSQEKTPELSTEQGNRYASARQRGITENFWMEPVDLDLGGKTFADLCVENSPLTYLEVNNRAMAGKDFNGFNIVLKEDEKMTLMYGDQAVATLTRMSRTVVRTEEEGEIREIQHFYRTNTFPPKLSSGMVPDDLEKMLGAISAVQACEGEPSRVAGAMISRFVEPDNVQRLKLDIDPKIQSKESKTDKLENNYSSEKSVRRSSFSR